MSNGRFNKTPFTDCQSCWKLKNPHGGRANSGTVDGASEAPSQDAAAIVFDISSIQISNDRQHPPQIPNALEDLVDMPNQPEAASNSDTPVAVSHPAALVTAPSVDNTCNHTVSHASSVKSIQLPVVLRHHIFKNGRWKLHVAKPHPTIKLSIFTRKLDDDQFNLRYPKIQPCDVDAVTHCSAQCCLMGWGDSQPLTSDIIYRI